MEKTYGIQEVLDLIELINNLATCIESCKSDGKIDAFDLVNILKLSPSILSAVKGSGDIKFELADLNGEEKDIVLKAVQEAMFKLVGALV